MLAPSAASDLATAAPMPFEAPVTIATFPESLPMTNCPSDAACPHPSIANIPSVRNYGTICQEAYMEDHEADRSPCPARDHSGGHFPRPVRSDAGGHLRQYRLVAMFAELHVACANQRPDCPEIDAVATFQRIA